MRGESAPYVVSERDAEACKVDGPPGSGSLPLAESSEDDEDEGVAKTPVPCDGFKVRFHDLRSNSSLVDLAADAGETWFDNPTI